MPQFLSFSITLLLACAAWAAGSQQLGVRPRPDEETRIPGLVLNDVYRESSDVNLDAHISHGRRSTRRSATRTAANFGNTLDFCKAGSRCNGNRSCRKPDRTTCSTRDSVCFCLPNVLVECSDSNNCANGEVCADARDSIMNGLLQALRPICVSAQAVKRLGALQLSKALPVPGDGRFYSRCRSDSDCEESGVCSFPMRSSFEQCKARSPCYCQPRQSARTFSCLMQSDCPNKKDVCAKTANYQFPMCVSKQAEGNLFSVKAVPSMKEAGLSFDPCSDNKHCAGGRVCTSVKTDNYTPCNGKRPCACLPAKARPCSNLGDCTKEEVCAQTPYFKTSICVSQASRKAYHFEQVDLPGTCPVLIPDDPPASLRLITQRSSDDMALFTESKIVGGLSISPRLSPYLVALKDRRKAFFCTGTLISSRYVLTAAHCSAYAGDYATALTKNARSGGVDIRVEKVHTHPKFVAGYDLQNDIAILRLAKDAPPGSKFMKLNVVAGAPADDSPVRACGYGGHHFASNGISGDRSLRQVDILTVPSDECGKTYSGFDVAPVLSKTTQICAGIKRGGCATCTGDSGGPIIQYQNGEPVHLGVSSFGVRCSDPDYPVVFTRTSAFVKWIQSETSGALNTTS